MLMIRRGSDGMLLTDEGLFSFSISFLLYLYITLIIFLRYSLFLFLSSHFSFFLPAAKELGKEMARKADRQNEKRPDLEENPASES